MGKCSKDKRDIYYRKAKEFGLRARSAFKLIQLNHEFQLFQGVTRAVDLCAAPGGWSQILAKDMPLTSERQIVAVDLMEMAPIEGVTQIKGDITHQKTVETIIECFHGHRAQLVVSDGAPDVLGLLDLDEYLQAQLVLAALNISLHLLETGGTFVAKIFRGKDVSLLYSKLSKFFSQVYCAKPKASRNSSFECFVVCKGFALPSDYCISSLDRPLLDDQFHAASNALVGPENLTVPFRACDGIYAFEPDMSYPLDDYTHVEPVQKPINPPYAKCM